MTVRNQNLIPEELRRGLFSVMIAAIQSRTFLIFVFCLYKDVRIYTTIILPAVLYECATWSLSLREKRRLKVFENIVLRRIFELKRDEVTKRLKGTA
jgi:hypothetical protein